MIVSGNITLIILLRNDMIIIRPCALNFEGFSLSFYVRAVFFFLLLLKINPMVKKLLLVLFDVLFICLLEEPHQLAQGSSPRPLIYLLIRFKCHSDPGFNKSKHCQ